MSRIIDVSHNNGNIDWSKVASDGIRVVYIKATQGVGYIDPKLKENAVKAAANNIETGYYHFASLNSKNIMQDATAEGEAFLNAIALLPSSPRPLVLDIEENELKLSPPEVLLWIKTFFATLSAKGKTDVMLYSYCSFLDSNLLANHGLQVPLWLAAYANTYKTPKGWTKPYMWQYSNNSVVKGINGNVDESKFI